MTKRDRTVLAVILGVALLAGFWFLAVAPKRKTAADLDKQLATQQQRLAAAQAKAGAAADAKRRYRADYAAVAKLGQAVPADDDVPSLVYQLDQAAKAERIDFRSLTVSGAEGNTGKAAAAPAAPAQAQGAAGQAPPAGADAGSSAQAAPSDPASTPAPAPATQAAAATLPPGASVGAAGFPTMPFTFKFDGTFFAMQKFLGRLDDFTKVKGENVSVNGRLLSVDGFELSAGRKGFPNVAASITATAYVLPPGEGLTNGATASGPAASGQSGSSSAAITSGDRR